MENEFKVGDIVQLRSGGTRMTIEQIDGTLVVCTWSDGQTLGRSTFIAGTLVKCAPNPVSSIKITRS